MPQVDPTREPTADASEAGETGETTPEMTAWPEVALKIIALRRAAQWSQRELAERIGYTQSQVSRWESGRSAVPIEAARAIIEAARAQVELVRRMRRDQRSLRAWLTGGESSATWPAPPPTSSRTAHKTPRGRAVTPSAPASSSTAAATASDAHTGADARADAGQHRPTTRPGGQQSDGAPQPATASRDGTTQRSTPHAPRA